MLTRDQNEAIDRLYDYDETLLIAPTGTGKTVILLTAIKALLDAEVLSRILILAPLKVCETTWRREAAKWDHLGGLEIAIATGLPAEREAAFNGPAPIVVVNEENVVSSVDLFDSFDGIAIDEISKWSDTGGVRFKALRHKMKGFSWRMGMTAQPVSEDWLGLFGQVLLLDLGDRYGRSKDAFKRRYFYPTDWEQRNWALLPTYDKRIARKLASLVFVMPDKKAETLPPKTIEVVALTMPAEAMEIYNEMRVHGIVDINGYKLLGETMAARQGKLEQIANGFGYLPKETPGDPAGWVPIHDVKRRWLRERAQTLVTSRSYGESVLIVYWYEADLEWLRRDFPNALELGGRSKKSALETLAQWQVSTGQIMLIHPASVGHGVDGLQDTCHRQLWINPVWSHSRHDQTMDRLWRMGQTEEVCIEIAVMRGTVDEVKLECVAGKGEHHELFLKHLGSPQ